MEGVATPVWKTDEGYRTGKFLRIIDGDTFVMLVSLWTPTRVKPAPYLDTHIRVFGWNAAELSEDLGPLMRDQFEKLLLRATRIDVLPATMNRERVVCHVWLDGKLFVGLLNEALASLKNWGSLS